MEERRVDNPLIEGGVRPSREIKPQSVGELCEIVIEAGRTGEKLVPVSSTPPHRSGAIVRREPHSIVDLSSWKKISHIDRRNRVCMIEPGVTYGELLTALSPYGLTVPMPLAPRVGKSVLSAVLDREPSTWSNKQWDSMDPLASMEVVFGDGSLFRTGAAGGPGTLGKQRQSGGAQKSPMGPSQTDFQRLVGGSQGSMGIATWITIRCELLPSIQEPRLVGSEDLGRLVDFVYAVQDAGLGEHCFLMDRAGLANLMGGSGDGLPAFIALLNVCGFQRLAAERVDYQLADLVEIAAPRKLALEKKLGPASAADVLNAALNPGGAAHRGNCLRVFFLSTLDKAPSFIKIFSEKTTPGGGVYLQPVVQMHACHVEFMIPYESAEADRLKGLERELVAAFADAGAFFSRPYGAAVEVAMKRNPLEAELQRRMKKVFDPGRVLSPGRLGL